MKIAVIGISGTGKSMLARRLSECTGIGAVFADSYIWDANWTLVNREEARKRMINELKSRGDWIFDGYITYVGDYVLEHADNVVYLDYSGLTALVGVLKRWWKYRNIPRPELARGCEEVFHWNYFFNTVLFKKENRRIKEFLEKYPPKELHRLRSKREQDDLIEQFCP